MKMFILLLALGSCTFAKSVFKEKQETTQKLEEDIPAQDVFLAWSKLVAVLAAKGWTPQDIGVGAPVPLPFRLTPIQNGASRHDIKKL